MPAVAFLTAHLNNSKEMRKVNYMSDFSVNRQTKPRSLRGHSFRKRYCPLQSFWVINDVKDVF